MSVQVKLDEDTFILYAMQNYDNPHCHSVDEFEEDLKRIQYIKRLLGRYRSKGELRERLVLNHLMVLYNCFGKSANNMLFMKLEGFHSYLKPFMELLNYLPSEMIHYGEKIIDINKIESDAYIADRLKSI